MTNVVLLMSDEHNAFVSSVHGHPAVRTPNMERLAASGTVFEQAYCPSPLCAPSRAAFMAGKPPHLINVFNNTNVIPVPLPSYGGVLAEQGIHTVHAGKLDVSAPADGLGFAELLEVRDRKVPGDTTSLTSPGAPSRDGLARADGFGIHDDPFAKDTEVVDAALTWISERAPSIEAPWTISINIGAPHFPHLVTRELWDRYSAAADLPRLGRDLAPAHHPYARDLRDYFSTDRFTDDQIRGLRQGYLGCVDYVDQQLGRVLAVLEEMGLLEDTVLIYTSDHGEMLGKFGMWWKCSMYEDSLRVPLIVAGPGFGTETRVRTPVSLFDVQATLFHATGGERSADWWGEPLQTLQPGERDRTIFAEYHGHGTRSGSFMIRKGPWKLLYHLAAPHQLFDLDRDPDELDNRYESEPAVVQLLESELRQICDPEQEEVRIEAFRAAQRAAIRAIA
ncbi:MAG TPA: sulfatase-like hydrolase/transferase [Thermomicrobiales bacterium]|nr:sulfatase-like hydrolase/transferase [Thermomicrobiales bacterium]